ncbi:hypothetical protein BGZ52_001322, partial [Haplosporangium bisporale]
TSPSQMRFFVLAVALSAIIMTQAAPAPVDKRGNVTGQGSACNSPGLFSNNVIYPSQYTHQCMRKLARCDRTHEPCQWKRLREHL